MTTIWAILGSALIFYIGVCSRIDLSMQLLIRSSGRPQINLTSTTRPIGTGFCSPQSRGCGQARQRSRWGVRQAIQRYRPVGDTAGRTASDRSERLAWSGARGRRGAAVPRESEDCTTWGVSRRSHHPHRGRDGGSFTSFSSWLAQFIERV